MTRVNSFSLLILIFTQLLLLIDVSASSSCQKKCGGIEILYPFGIGVGCYLNKWYEIQCINDGTPFLYAVGKEVVHISLPLLSEFSFEGFDSLGSVRIKNPITSKGCSSDERKEATGPLLNLTGSPFYVGHMNNLVAVGCNITASLTNMEPSVVRCSSSCRTSHSSPRPTQNYLAFVGCKIKKVGRFNSFTKCDATSITKDTFCNGVGCCQASIPDELQQVVGVSIEESTTTSGGDCKVAFLTDEAYSVRHISDPKWLHAQQYVTVDLGWFIHTRNVSFIDSLECEYMSADGWIPDYSGRNSCACYSSSDSSYASCACNRGYRGNPYTLGGCKDVDECLEKNNTRGDVPCLGETCVNKPGGYSCYERKTQPIALGIGLITGAKPISFLRSQENRTLATYFILTMKENKLEEIIDARIREGCKLEQLTATAKLARKCLNLKGRKRPSMKQVSIELERIRSSGGDSQLQVIVESDEEEETVEVNIGVESWNNVAVTDNVATSFLDAEPLFPRQTW
ncbi:unnamed protein product [Thlaspi arvense]|uniref:EGF-like calcium-binding domain-containing protein n=1 Tax=Thlaspi arvense TaxID=13288 RepID=A0AAU9T7S9_THLAR|nr:unnamed protein product [Thlaspi arvense]